MAEAYPWQAGLWQQLARRERHAHAYLLHGPAGIGKRDLAERLGALLLCGAVRDDAACGACKSCLLLRAGSHPDFFELQPEEADKPIRVDQVRELVDFVVQTAQLGGRKLVLLEPAEAMNLNAANALLKVLEEPPADVVFLLVSDALQKLLPTLRSRCRIFPLTAPSQAQALAWLNAHGEADAAVELAHAGGAPFALDDAAWRPLRRKLLSALAQPGMTAILDAAGALDSAKLPLAAPVGWMQRWLHDLLGLRLARSGKFRWQ